MIRSLIVAVAENQVIGHQGELPWRLSSDLQRFKRLTMGHHLIMGRKTYDSIGRLLPGRTTVIVTRNPSYRVDGAKVVHSLAEAYEVAQHDQEAFVIGGGEIYAQALPQTDRIYRTLVHASVAGDAFFPPLEPDTWQIVSQTELPADAKNEFPHSFQVLHRK